MKISISPSAVLAYDDAGSGPPVVLLHAFPLCRDMWHPQRDALSAEYHVFVPDLRGFGGSSPFHRTPSVEDMADDVAALLDVLKLTEPVVLGGLSMGGYVALAFARRHAAKLRALVLADTKAEADSAEAKANRDKLIEFARGHSPTDVVDQLLPKLLGDQTRAQRPQVAEEVRKIAALQTTGGIIAALQALRDRPDATPGLAATSVPTLVIVGAEDTLTPPSAAQALAKGIRGARLTTIDGAGHLSNMEQPDAFNSAVRDFLRSL
jgi:3-oxoadipate enol-lactonase